MSEQKLSKETKLIIQEDGNVTIAKKLPLGPNGRMLEFSFPLTAEEWEHLQSMIFNQDSHSPQCADCLNPVYSCVCKPEKGKRKKVVVSDAMLKEFDEAAEEWNKWENDEDTHPLAPAVVCIVCGKTDANFAQV